MKEIFTTFADIVFVACVSAIIGYYRGVYYSIRNQVYATSDSTENKRGRIRKLLQVLYDTEKISLDEYESGVKRLGP